jgi:Uma2 family endonuclease
MHVDLLREAIAGRPSVVPLTVHQYHRMIELGILEEGEPIELLDGLLVRKDRGAEEGDVTVSPLHGVSVTKIMGLAATLKTHGLHVRIQQPITIPPDHEPEPDAAIVRGSIDAYTANHPGPDDVAVVIEVADSSLGRDRGVKQRIYATAAIPQYVIVNLRERVVEVYEVPQPERGRYDRTTRTDAGASFSLRLGGTAIELRAEDWLP